MQACLLKYLRRHGLLPLFASEKHREYHITIIREKSARTVRSGTPLLNEENIYGGRATERDKRLLICGT